MKIAFNPQTGFPEIELDLKSIANLIASVFPEKNEFINYNPSWVREYYNNNDINWLRSTSDRRIFAPYEVINDYRSNPIENWGTYKFTGDFEFPTILSRVKDEMIKIFTEKGLLYKGDNPCPRVSNVVSSQNSLSFDIQKAYYFDQVATNLSLDYCHKQSICERIKRKTIRDWDKYQSKTTNGKIPTFTKSKLANTIGVALGIITTNKKGEKVIIIRRRTSSVAVYRNMFHLPFSFSLNFDSHTLENNHIGSIKELIKPDFRHEQAEELGLEPAEIDFSQVKPLLFCRDLYRGGKPQFFLELEIKTPFEDLAKRITESSGKRQEFLKKTIGLTFEETKKSLRGFSPELIAYMVARME